jgi:hypothetical protein
MESTGRAECVQLSGAAFAACGLPEGIVATRFVDVKGKGHMDTFIVPAAGEVEVAVRRALAAPFVAPAAAAAAPGSPAPGAPAGGGAAAATPRASACGRWRTLSVAVRATRALGAGGSGAGSGAGSVADLADTDDGGGGDSDAAAAGEDDDAPRALLPPPPSAAADGALAAAAPQRAPSSVHGGSASSVRSTSGGACAAAAARDAAAGDALRALGLSHIAAALFSLWAPPLLFHGNNARNAARFLADGVPGAAAVLAVYRPAFAAVAAACVAAGAVFLARSRLPLKLRARLAPHWGAALVWSHAALMMFISVTHALDAVLIPSDGSCGAWVPGAAGDAQVPPHPSVCARAQFWPVHTAFVPMLWLQAQLPLRLVIFPEVLRNLQYAALTLAAAAALAPGAPPLTAGYVASVLCEAAAATLLVPFVLGLSYEPTHVAADLLAPVETCPRPLRPARDALVAAAAGVRARAFRGAALLDDQGAFVISAQGFALVFQGLVLRQNTTLRTVTSRLNAVLAFVLAASAATKLRPTASAPSLDALAARLGLASEQRVLRELRDALAAARSEAAMLRAACDALGALYPGAAAWAVGAFAEGAGCDLVSALEAGPNDDAVRAPLLASLPPDVGAAALSPAAAAAAAAAGAEPGGGTSVAAACAAGGARVLDSRDVHAGIMAFADWAAAAAAGLPSAQAVTAPLTAGPRVIGFATVHFGLYAARAHNWAPLTEFTDALGGALFVARAFAINAGPGGGGGGGAHGHGHAGSYAGRAGGASAGARARHSGASASASAACDEDDAPYPATEEDAAALAALDASAGADAPILRAWSLDAWSLDAAELQRLLLATLHAAGLLRRFRLSPTAAAGFIADVALHMNDNPCAPPLAAKGGGPFQSPNVRNSTPLLTWRTRSLPRLCCAGSTTSATCSWSRTCPSCCSSTPACAPRAC